MTDNLNEHVNKYHHFSLPQTSQTQHLPQLAATALLQDFPKPSAPQPSPSLPAHNNQSTHYAYSLKPFHYYRKRCQSDRKSTRLNSSHVAISYAVFCLKKKMRLSELSHELTRTAQQSVY